MNTDKPHLCPMLMQGWYADMLGHWLRDVGAGAATMEQADNAKRKACSCEGSRCAWWFQKRDPVFDIADDGSSSISRPALGNCSKNAYAPPWEDPATE